VVARVNGSLQRVAPDQVERFCRENVCEENISYQEVFARKRAKPPAPEVPVPPPAADVPGDLAGECYDFSKSKMRVFEAWKVSRGSEDVVVAVIDSGLDVKHPDLSPNLWVNAGEAAGKPGVDDDGNGYVDDVHGWDFVNDRPIVTGGTDHGTHVAGTIAAAVNGRGTVGVAPKVKIMALQFIGASGNGYLEDAVAAIEYAVKNGARVINSSWGGAGFSDFLNEAIQEAISKNVLFVAAAGNNGRNTDSNPFYPAQYEGVIAVGATDSNDQLASYSNFGAEGVEVVAPGTEIYSTFLNGNYGVLSGTSMASPQVAGVLALGASVRPGASAVELKQALFDSAVPLFPGTIRYGRVDAAAFLQRL
jgi:subtilisin family serine protease